MHALKKSFPIKENVKKTNEQTEKNTLLAMIEQWIGITANKYHICLFIIMNDGEIMRWCPNNQILSN